MIGHEGSLLRWIAAVLLAAGLATAPGWAAEIDVKINRPTGIAQATGTYQGAIRAYDQGEFRMAFDLLSPLFREEPDNPEYNFALGMAAVGINKLSHASTAFERVIALQPDNDRARLELARTYSAMGQFELAQEIFRQVLANDPPAPVQRNINRYLDQLEGAQKRWRVGLQAGTGYVYDDNANVGPDGRVIPIAPTRIGLSEFDQLELADGAGRRAASGVFLLGGVYVTYDPGFRGRWTGLGGVSYYQTILDHANEFELGYLRTFAGVRHVAAAHLFDARFKYEYLEQGAEQLNSLYGLEAAYTYATSENLNWTTHGEAGYLDYDRLDDLDAVYYEAGETVTYLLPWQGVSLAVSGAGFYEDADAEAFANYGLDTSAHASVGLPFALDLRAGGGYRYSDYREREPLAPEDRRDHQWVGEVALSRSLAPGLNLSTAYRYTRNRSTFDLYDYQKNVVNISLDYSN